jgi:hypothetical protein
MSLGILIKATEGLVLAAESRVTLSFGGTKPLNVNFDNATKLFSFHKPFDKIGVVTYGQAAIGFRTAHSFIPEFESTLKEEDKNISILDFAKRLSKFFLDQWKVVMPSNIPLGQDMVFNVAGFDDGEPYGKIYSFQIPTMPDPMEQSPIVNGQHQFGITYGGQREIVDRLVFGYDPRMFQLLATHLQLDQSKLQELQKVLLPLTLQLPIQVMPLQDCVDIALLFLKTTIEAQKLTIGVRGCGGAIDLAIIRRNNPLEFIQQKLIIGEKN